jgi:hypothetical protein
VLHELIRSGNASDACLIALGLLGEISIFEVLLTYLKNEEFAESAVLALNLITGAELYEDVFVPEQIDEDELFENELEKFREGQVPSRSDGEPYGITVTRLSQKPEDWQKWWVENKSRFKPGIRYRNGEPYSPACLLNNLEFEKSPRIFRQLAYEELVIRYGIDFPFETDMLVSQQKDAIVNYAAWINANNSRFEPGLWYFAGEKI